jgi:holliday junction DNA helicase RuvA
MIGRLRGCVVDKQLPCQVLLDVGGIGYEIEMPARTFSEMNPESDQEVILHTHLSVREDAQVLYGFSVRSERQFFRALIRINGVGPKLALGILSHMPVHEFVHCITTDDSAALTKIPGIGKKTAGRLLIEMRDRLSDLDMPSGQGELKDTVVSPRALSSYDKAVQDAVAVLVSLGCQEDEARRLVMTIPDAEALTASELSRQALKSLPEHSGGIK